MQNKLYKTYEVTFRCKGCNEKEKVFIKFKVTKKEYCARCLARRAAEQKKAKEENS